MTNSAFNQLYENLATLLKADAAFVDPASLNGSVDPANIRPFHDAQPPAPGGLIVFGLFSVQWDPRYKRGQAELNINAEHPTSGKISEAMLQRIRDIIGAGALTGNGCRVMLFLEQPQGTFDMASKLGGYTTKASFRIRLVASQ